MNVKLLVCKVISEQMSEKCLNISDSFQQIEDNRYLTKVGKNVVWMFENV